MPPASDFQEIRRCEDPDDLQYGNVAHKGTGLLEGKWVVSNSGQGAHIDLDSVVEGWAVIFS